MSYMVLFGALSNAASFLLTKTRFADVTHEVKPVTSGRRLVLTYNLVYTNLGAPKPEITSPGTVTLLREILSIWLQKSQQDGSDISCLKAWLFDHHYTDASLSYGALKGRDRTVAAHLRAVAGELGFHLYLANLDMEVHGGCDEDEYADPFEEYDDEEDEEDEDEDDDGYTVDRNSKAVHPIVDEVDRDVWLSKVVDLDGREIMTDIAFDEENFIQEEPLKDEEPDDEEFGIHGERGCLSNSFLPQDGNDVGDSQFTQC